MYLFKEEQLKGIIIKQIYVKSTFLCLHGVSGLFLVFQCSVKPSQKGITWS